MIAQKLHEAVQAVCPIAGVSIGSGEDKATWRIDYLDEATPAQRAAAEGVMDSFDVSMAVAAAKIAQINAAFEAASEQLVGAYPPSERLSWPTQEKEALDWRSNSASATPYIDALARARGIDRIDYVNRTLAKVDAFRAASAKLIGARQRYEDQVNAAQQLGNGAAIHAIAPVFVVT